MKARKDKAGASSLGFARHTTCTHITKRHKDSETCAPVKSGWMPPCMHTSVAPRSHASAVRRVTSGSGSR